MHPFPPHLVERLHRQRVHNSFVMAQTTDARSPLQRPGLEMDAEKGAGVGSHACARIFAGFNGPYLSTRCDNFKQNKIKTPFNEELHIQFCIQSKNY